MLIFSENRDLTYKYLGNEITEISHSANITEEIKPIYSRIFSSGDVYNFKSSSIDWKYLFLVEETDKSQFDLLVELNSGSGNLPDGLICIAAKGKGFHGFRNRAWEALDGNIHLSIFFRPKINFQYFHAGLLMASAVSVIETIDRIPGLKDRAKTKWVNDITIDGGKVCGVITQSSSAGNSLTGAIIGIGLNVLSQPDIIKDRFTPRAVSLASIVDPEWCSIDYVLSNLLRYLRNNIDCLNNGKYSELYNKYCDRSAVIGKRVAVYTDPVNGKSEEVVSGRVIKIGKNLELYFKDVNEPIRSGRLAMLEQAE